MRQTIAIDPFKPPPAFQPLGGVAVIADNTWAAFQGRKKLKMVWDNGPNETYDSAQYKKELQETARKPAKVVRSAGDVDSVFCQGRQDHGGRLLRSAAGPRFDGADGSSGGFSRRQSDGLGADAKSSSRARHRVEGVGHRKGERHLPRDIARRRLRPQIQTRLRR